MVKYILVDNENMAFTFESRRELLAFVPNLSYPEASTVYEINRVFTLESRVVTKLVEDTGEADE